MQPWLQPMQAMHSASRPSRALRDRSGSAISARVMPTASAAPGCEQPLGLGRRRDARGRDQRHARPPRGRARAAPAIAASGAGGGGTIQVDAAHVGRVADHERARSRSARRARARRGISRARRARRAPRAPARRPRGGCPTASPGPRRARTAASTSSAKRQPLGSPPRTRRRAGSCAAEELRDQVAVRHRHLDAVDPGLAHVAATVSWSATRSSHLAPVRARGSILKRWLGTAEGATAGARGGSVDLLAAAVEELHEEPRAVVVHRVGQRASRRRSPGVARDRVRGQQAARVHRRGLDADRAGTAGGARRVVGHEVVGRQAVVDEPRLVGRRDDAVGERDRPEARPAVRSWITPGTLSPCRAVRPACEPATAGPRTPSAVRRGRA